MLDLQALPERMERIKRRYAVLSLCIGFGQEIAMVNERLD